MENFLIGIFSVMDKSLTNKLSRLEIKMRTNRKNFEKVKEMSKELQEKIFDIYSSNDEELTTSEQIGFMFRMVEKDPHFESFENFDISKVINEDRTLSHRENEVLLDSYNHFRFFI